MIISIPTNLMLPKRPALGVKICPRCGKQFNVRGYGMHQKACKELDGPAPTIDAGSVDPELSEDGASCKTYFTNFPTIIPLLQVTQYRWSRSLGIPIQRMAKDRGNPVKRV